MFVLAVMVAEGVSPLSALLVVLASYTVAVPTRPALSAIVPAVAGEGQLASGNAVLSAIRQVMTFVGPLLGVAVAAWSASAGFAVNAITFATSGLILAGIRGIPDRSVGRADGSTEDVPLRLGLVSSAVDGVRTVRSIAALPALVVLIGIMYVVRGAEMVLHVYVVRDQLDTGVGDVGLLGGAIGLGALLATPIAARTARSRSPVRPILVSIVLTAIPTAALAVITQTVWACAVLVFVGVGMVVFEVVIVVMVQRVTPSRSLGRVFGAVNGAANTGKLVGAIAAPVRCGPRSRRVAHRDRRGVALDRNARHSSAGRGRTPRRPTTAFAGPDRTGTGEARHLRRSVAAVTRANRCGCRGAGRRRWHRRHSPGRPARQPLPGDSWIVAGVGGRPGVGQLGDGDWFGEIGLLDRRPRTASVTTSAETVLWRIPGSTFLSVLEDAGAPPSALLDSIADRLSTHR